MKKDLRPSRFKSALLKKIIHVPLKIIRAVPFMLEILSLPFDWIANVIDPMPKTGKMEAWAHCDICDESHEKPCSGKSEI